MKAVILDTETATLNGTPIQISHMPCDLSQGAVVYRPDDIFDAYFSADGESICFAAMAVHHIIEDDLVGKPSYKTFRMPEGVEYVIGHKIGYDLAALAKCGVDIDAYKPICTLALARAMWPDAPAHNLGALIYMLNTDKAYARNQLQNSHNAKVDILNTAQLLHILAQKYKAINLHDLYTLSQDALVPKFITFGKHKGTALVNLPDDYVRWLLRQDDLDPHLRKGLLERKVK